MHVPNLGAPVRSMNWTTQTNITSLREAIGQHVRSGATVALEGFTHLIPHAAAHEIIRQGITDLHLVRMTPDIAYDQLIGAGCASALTFSWGGNPGVGSLHRLRDAVEHAWPRPIHLEEHSHAGMATRYAAGAAGLPFGVLRGYVGTDLALHTTTIKTVTCPFTGEALTAVPALNPDVTVIHAQRADGHGTVQMWGLIGVQKEAVLAASKVIVTVEELVDELEPVPGAIMLPSWVVDCVCEVPGGAHPSFAMGYSERDNAFYREWDGISRDRDRFESWIEDNIRNTADFAEFRMGLRLEGMAGV